MKKIFIFIIIIFLVIISLFFIFKNRKTETPETNTNVKNIYTTYTIENTDIGDYIEITGTVEADERLVLSEVSGKVTDIYVDKGQKITEGDMLAKFEDLEYKIAYLNDLKSYELAINDSAKNKEIKELQLELSKKNLENTELKSPVSGTISEINIGEGDYVPKNQTVMKIVDTNSLRVESVIDEVDLSKIKKGMKAQIEFDQLNVIIPAEITLINPVAVTSNGLTTIPIELEFTEDPNKYGIIPGITGDVKIILMETKNQVVIPKNALNKDNNGNYFVFIKENNEPKKINVEIGQETDDKVIIKSGLEIGQTIIIYPNSEEMKRLNEKFGEGIIPGIPGQGGSRRNYPGGER